MMSKLKIQGTHVLIVVAAAAVLSGLTSWCMRRAASGRVWLTPSRLGLLLLLLVPMAIPRNVPSWVRVLLISMGAMGGYLWFSALSATPGSDWLSRLKTRLRADFSA